MGPVLCRLWGRLAADAGSMAEISDVMPEIKSMLACSGE
jgi:hypothetical protein